MTAPAALLVIDVQLGLIEGFQADWRDVMPVIGTVLARAHAQRVPVVFVQHCGAGRAHPVHRDRPGWGLASELDVHDDDLRVEKTWSDAFCDTDLDGLLRERGVDSVAIVGAQTEYCVDATARRALSLGYDVALVADGHTTSGNGLLDRDQIIAHHNQTLANLATDGSVLTVVDSSELAFAPSRRASR